MIHLYYCDISDAVNMAKETGNVPDRLICHLTSEREERVHRFKNMSDKIRCAAAGELLYRALLTEHGDKLSFDKLEFATQEYGKPYIKNLEDFHFSISHSGDYVVLTCSQKPLGIDVQTMSRRVDIDSMVRHIYSDFEKERMQNITDPDMRRYDFFRVWAAKESFIKMTGLGLRKPMNSFTTDLEKMEVYDGADEAPAGFLTELSIFPGNTLAVCSGARAKELQTECVIV